MTAFLFSWNPDKWPWPRLEEDVEQVRSGRMLSDQWSCAAHRAVRPGDRAFFIRVAREPKGLFGSGYISSPAFPAISERTGKQVYRVNITYDVLLDPHKMLLPLSLLQMGELARQQWAPQSAGISIRPHLLPGLEALWADFLNEQQLSPLRKP